GWKLERVVMGSLTNKIDGYGFMETKTVIEVVRSLRRESSRFGRVCGWDYFDIWFGVDDGGMEP
ncbi:hypothetical protein BJ878DRAFT_419809, partial [Calycina marina]